MTRKIAVVLASVALLAAACGGSGHEEKRPDVHACKAAMVQRFHDALTTDAPEPTSTGLPAACAGVSQEDLLKIIAEIFTTDSPVPE